jgi:hypothetical protein
MQPSALVNVGRRKLVNLGRRLTDLRSAVEIYKEDRHPDWISLVGLLVIFLAAVYRLITAVF